MPSQDDPRFLTMDGEIVDPFDSLDSMIKHEDLHKFVLFKTHYRKYMDVSMAYEDLMGRIESYEEELDHVKTQEMKAMEDLETLQTLLREKEVLLQKKEDELFSADEKITQLECDLDEERGRGSKLKLDLTQLIEEKQNLAKQHQAILREKNEIQLRLQVEKSKSSEDEISRSENSRLAKNLDDVTKDREKWRTKWEDLYTKVKSLESLWRETRELQGLLRAGIEHLANCSRPSSCRMCCRVRDSYIKNGLVQTSNGNKDGQLLDSRRKHANLLRTQYQRLTHLIGTLLPAPIATFDPGLDGPLPSKDDSGFVDVDVDDTDDGIDGASPCSTLQRRIPRRKSFNGVPDRLINGTASKEPQATSPGTPPSATGATGATAATSTAKKSAFTRMSRLTKSFGYAERGRKHLLTSPNGSPEHALEEDVSSKGANNNGALRKGAADEGDENDEGGFVAANGATSNGLNGVHGKGDVGHKHKLGPVRKFFSRMSVRLKHRRVVHA